MAQKNLLKRAVIHLFCVLYLNQIITLCNCKEDVKRKVHSVIDKFAERGLRSLAVARQVGKYVFLNVLLSPLNIF